MKHIISKTGKGGRQPPHTPPHKGPGNHHGPQHPNHHDRIPSPYVDEGDSFVMVGAFKSSCLQETLGTKGADWIANVSRSVPPHKHAMFQMAEVFLTYQIEIAKKLGIPREELSLEGPASPLDKETVQQAFSGPNGDIRDGVQLIEALIEGPFEQEPIATAYAAVMHMHKLIYEHSS